MSDLFDLAAQAREVAETAKEAMDHSLVADKTTESLARTILEEAKRLLPQDQIVKSVNLPSEDAGWVSVRSAMQAVANALTSANRQKNRQIIPRRRGGPWSS
jgi:hypothetical protein